MLLTHILHPATVSHCTNEPIHCLMMLLPCRSISTRTGLSISRTRQTSAPSFAIFHHFSRRISPHVSRSTEARFPPSLQDPPPCSLPPTPLCARTREASLIIIQLYCDDLHNEPHLLQLSHLLPEAVFIRSYQGYKELLRSCSPLTQGWSGLKDQSGFVSDRRRCT